MRLLLTIPRVGAWVPWGFGFSLSMYAKAARVETTIAVRLTRVGENHAGAVTYTQVRRVRFDRERNVG